MAHDRQASAAEKEKPAVAPDGAHAAAADALAGGAGADCCCGARGVLRCSIVPGMRRCPVSTARCMLRLSLASILPGARHRRKARVIAETRINVSPDPYYRERLPWRSWVWCGFRTRADRCLCHLHGDVGRGDRGSHGSQARQGRAGRDDRSAAGKGHPTWRTIRNCASSQRTRNTGGC